MILQLRHISRCFLVLWILCLASAGAEARTPQISPEGGSAERFGAVPEFSLTSSQGQTVTLQSLLGSPWVAVPFFVRCTGPCPNVTTDLRAVVYPELLESGAKLVSFSLDPNFDDPAALAEYAANYDIDTDRWLFLTGSSDAVVELIRGGLKIPLDFRPEADLEEGEQAIEHGTKLPVIDAEGQIAGWYAASRGKLGTGLTSGQADLDLRKEMKDKCAHYENRVTKVSTELTELQTQELKNGRLAMLAAAGMIVQGCTTHHGCITNLVQGV